MRWHALILTIGWRVGCLWLLGVAPVLAAPPWVWPISGTAMADEMNTSFGPRTDSAKWDFHDGIDLPIPVGTDVLAVDDGVVFREGPGGTDGISSRHVVIAIPHPVDGTVFAYYLHLSAIDPAIVEGGGVSKGQVVGEAGADGATYSHLHFETRRGVSAQIASVHPLHYLSYGDTFNFTAPVLDRVQRIGARRAARLRFGAASRLEGDLLRVEVELFSGATWIETRVVDFDDKTTISEGNEDRFEWTGNIAVEGYQRSNMIGDGRSDLQYGILLREIPPSCDGLVARAQDLAGNLATSPLLALAGPPGFDAHLDFEDGAMPPVGWTSRTSSSGTGTTIGNSVAAFHDGSRGLLATDASSSEGGTQSAALEIAIPAGRFQWAADGWFRPNAWVLAPTRYVALLQFQSGIDLSAAAVMRNNSGAVQAGIYVRRADGTIGTDFSTVEVAPGAWVRWTFELLRVGTREATAVLYHDGAEIARRNWENTVYEPDAFRAGIGQDTAGATATVSADEIFLDEDGHLAFPAFAPGRISDGTTPGVPLRFVKAGASYRLDWGGSCNFGGTDYAVFAGALTSFGSHAALTCSTAGEPSLLLAPPTPDGYFVVAPRSISALGSLGVDSAGVERPVPGADCVPQLLGACP